MPGVIEAITFLVISAQAGALGAGFSAVFGTTGFLTTVISTGLSILSSILFRPKQPKPEDVQNSVKNPTAPRQRHYGRVKTSGPWVFCESKDGSLHKVLALGTGQLDAVEEFWIDDIPVTIDGGGEVLTEPFNDGGGDYKVRILYRLGLPTETYYSELEAAFPEYTADHRGDGVSTLYALHRPAAPEGLANRFPNLINTLYRVVARGSRVYNLNPNSPPDSPPVDAWTDNAAGIIRDYMTHQDGMRLPLSLFTTTQAHAGWQLAYSRCAELIDKKAGGTEARYRLWGAYTFDERPADVLGRMLACCDGRIIPTPDGGITLEIGDWEDPTVILDTDVITGFSDLRRGRDILTTANTIKATFLSPLHDYQATDADPWVDAADVSARGEIALDTPFNMAPSHGQARRLMKLAAYRAKPNWVGTFQCNLRALAAFGKRFVRITYPLFEINEVFEITDFRFNIGEGNILIGVTLQVQSMPQEAYEWDAETEEGDEPVAEDVTVDREIPEPANFTFTEQTIAISGQNVSVGVVSFDEPPSEAFIVQANYKKTSDTTWLVIPIGEGETEGKTGVLEDGVEYEARVRYITITGRVGEWTDSETLTPLANPNAPTALVSATVTSVTNFGYAQFNFVTSSDSNNAKVNIYRVPAGDTLDKNTHEKIVVNSNPGSSFSYFFGDSSRTNQLADPGMTASTDWVEGTGWTHDAGNAEFDHAVSNATNLGQSVAALTGSTAVWRYGFNMSAYSAGNFRARLTGGTAHSASNHTGTGWKLGTITANGGNTVFNINTDSAAIGSVTYAAFYVQTSASAPQGTWDFYPFPANASGVEGTGATPITGVVIV